MLGFWAGHVIAPLHEAVLRRPTFACLRELERSQWASPQEIRALQRRKLKALLRHAWSTTPFYRDRIGRMEQHPSGGDRGGCDPFEILSRIPTLTKSTIRCSIDQMLWRDAPGGLHERHTGGSCGQPLRFFLDKRRQAYDQAARARSHRWFGVNCGEREVYLWGSPIEFRTSDRAKRVRDRLFNHFMLNAFDMSPRRMTRYWHRIRRLRPSCLFGYPSSLALLARHAKSEALPRLHPGLKAVFVTGEVCLPHDRAILEEVFRVPVADGYGSREAGFIAHQCGAGQMHITGENVIVEIMQGETPVPPGDSGEIVITHLDCYAMPMIRYRTGDVGRLLPGRCACGRGLPLMSVVEGRSTDFLYLPDGTTKHALSVIYPLRALPGIERFRVTQRVDYSLDVEVVVNEGVVSVSRASVASALQPVVGDHLALDVRFVKKIETSASGKFRYVISHAEQGVRVPVGSR